MTTPPKPPKVLIVGAGLGGLAMAILLERAGVDYEVFERSRTPRSLGSATTLTPNIQAIFEQLGLLPGLEAISKIICSTDLYKENMDIISQGQMPDAKDRWGYSIRVMARPDLHKLLLDQVPSNKIFMGKKVLSIEQNDDEVMIHTSDGKVHRGDILIGADGAYSAVRKSLYSQMKEKEILPATDDQALKVCHMSFLGTTDPLDPEKYPGLKATACQYDSILGSYRPETWRYFTVPNNRVCWRVDVHVESANYEGNAMFNNSEWGSESCETLPEEWNDFKVPLGGTLGDLIAATPIEARSKVVLEEKVFETWYHKRIVLMGDACHKLLPHSGRGGVNAFSDAVVLANAIYEANSSALPDITAAFKDYYDQRFPAMAPELANSQQMGRIMAGQTWRDAIMRKIALGLMPQSLRIRMFEKSLLYRPQASFIPLVPDRGVLPILPLKLSKRYQETQRQQQEQAIAA